MGVHRSKFTCYQLFRKCTIHSKEVWDYTEQKERPHPSGFDFSTIDYPSPKEYVLAPSWSHTSSLQKVENKPTALLELSTWSINLIREGAEPVLILVLGTNYLILFTGRSMGVHRSKFTILLSFTNFQGVCRTDIKDREGEIRFY